MLGDYDPQFQEPLARVREAASLVLMVLAVWEVVRQLAVRLMEESLTVRAQQRELWPVCGRCRQWLQSKGFQPRTLHTLFGVICWRRRVGRCPKGYKGSPVAPLDQALGLVPHQRTGAEVQWMGCLLAVFVPYETAPITAAVDRGRAGGGHALGVGPAGGATGDGAARGRVRSAGGGGTPRGRALNRGTGSAAAGDRRGWGDGTVSTAPPPGEGENPVAGDQGGDPGLPGRAADPRGDARDPALAASVSSGVGHDRRLGPPVVAGSGAPRGAHGGAGGVAIGWRPGFVERVPAPLPGDQGHRDFRLLPCRTKPV